MTSQSFTQLIHEKFKENGCISDASIARKVGLLPSTFYALKKRDFNHLRKKTMHKFAVALDMDDAAFMDLYLTYKEGEHE